MLSDCYNGAIVSANHEKLKEAIREETKRFEAFHFWLEKSMPQIFFKEISPEHIILIVHNLMGLPEQDYFASIHLKHMAFALTLDSPESDVKVLEKYPFHGIKNFTTYISTQPLPFQETKKNLRVAVIHFTEGGRKVEAPLNSEKRETFEKELQQKHPTWSAEKCRTLIEQSDPAFLRILPQKSGLISLELMERAQQQDHCQYEVIQDKSWKEKGGPSCFILMAWKNVPKHNFLYRLARVIFQHGLVMRRVNATYINPYQINSILLLAFGLDGSQKGQAAWEATDLQDFLQELVTLKYFGSLDQIDSTFVKPHLLRGNLGNLLRTMTHFIHQVLVNVDPHLYTLENIYDDLCRHPELTLKLCETFEHKFHPLHHNLVQYEKSKEEFLALVDKLDTGNEFLDIRRKHILAQGMNFVVHILKTNFYRINKTAFSFRLDPTYLDRAPFDRKKIFPELPFGIFFMKGMHFIAFHIRFKNLARGGLRTVFPTRKERVLAERNTVFSECYNLAYTQHKKNKDIPEGGAKGIIFLKPYEHLTQETEIFSGELQDLGLSAEDRRNRLEKFQEEQKIEYLYATQRAFIQSFLTLINCRDDGSLMAQDIVDYWKKPEYIYLGPDENMHNSMIEWIAQESKKEGYKPRGAFISGKPKLGINHKEYGVTSLGVNVCMHEMLLFLGIDPLKESFSLKMTGGPDGDVAGNEIVNLYKYYPKTAKLIALTDVSGTIFDPQGLDLKSCTDLFYQSKPIRFYPPEKLSPGSFLLDKERRREPSPYVQETLCWRNEKGVLREDWISGNEMHLLYRHNVHEKKADIFIPCGGRPRTLRDTNYKDFFLPSGEPSAKGVIEGANLYFSPWARHALEEAGVLIIKDSSANKCGVICSSFEILCGLTLTDEEFLKHKDQLVQEILDRLKELAAQEARLLLTSYRQMGTPMSELSDEISKRINYFTDQLLAYLEPYPLPPYSEDPLIQCFLHYAPRLLRENYQHALLQNIPDNHKKAIIASHIASRLVYKKGLNWFPTLVDILPLLLKDKDLIY